MTGAQHVPPAAAEILRVGRTASPPTSFGKLAGLIGCSDLTAKRWASYLGLDVTTHGQSYGKSAANHPVWSFPGAPELARRLWDDPNYSSAAIAAELVKLTGAKGTTKNHVIGWAHRHFWPLKVTKVRYSQLVHFGRIGPRATPDPIPPKPKAASVATVRANARDRIAQEEVVVGLFDEPQDVDVRRATRGSAKPLPVPGYRSPHRTCQWIEGNARPWRFCDEPADHGGTSYCAAHCEVAYARRSHAA